MAKKKNQNNDGCADGGGGNKENGGVVVVVLKIDLHCEGCAGRVVKAVRSLDGVESVRIGDSELNKITVIGKLDPVKLRQKVEEKTKKKVEVISPATKKEKEKDGAGEHKKQQKQPQQQQSPPEKEKTVPKKNEKKPKELPVTTAVLKVPLHCQGCIQKIQKHVSKTKGFMDMSVDKSKDLVTVKGGIDMKLLADGLSRKLKRPVDIVPPKKDGGGGGGGDGGGDKKGKAEKKGKDCGGGGGGDGTGGGHQKGKGKGKGGGGGGDGKDGGGGGNVGGGGKVEGHRLEYNGAPGEYPYPYPQHVYGSGYVVNYVHAPQLFSDENPNACVVM